MPLNTDFIKNKWIPALRSGKYRQAHGALSREGGYCCLGVACDIIAKEGRIDGAHWGAQREGVRPFYAGGGGEGELLPRAVGEFLGITAYGTLDGAKDTGFDRYDPDSLIDLNDNLCYTFEQIADVLEQAIDPDSGVTFVSPIVGEE